MKLTYHDLLLILEVVTENEMLDNLQDLREFLSENGDKTITIEN